jgi:hypothetical protein
MGRISNLQKQAEQEFFQNRLTLSVIPSCPPIKNPCLPISDQSPDTTKETQDKRVSLPNAPTQEGSPFREANPSRSGQRQTNSLRNQINVGMVREVFGWQTLYSVDGHGRRSRIETEHLSDEGYNKLLPIWWKTDLGETPEEKWATIRANIKMASEKRALSKRTWKT